MDWEVNNLKYGGRCSITLRYNVENQRNFAYFLLESRRHHYSISRFFLRDEPVIIYGYDFIGREIFYEIKDYVNVLFIVDRSFDGWACENVPVYSLDNPVVNFISRKYDSISLINVIISDEKRIYEDVLESIPNAKYISLYEIFSFCKMRYNTNFLLQQNEFTILSIKRVLDNTKPDFRNIILTGTSYTLLLSILYVKDWRDSIFLMEKYVSSSIAERMRKTGIRCLHEQYSVEHHDLCYLLAKYSKKWNIPVLGHDHLLLSRPFLIQGMDVIEDGLANYDICASKDYIIVMDDGRRYYPLGYDNWVRKVILTGQFEIPEILQRKVELIRPSELWQEKSVEEKKKIMDIMEFPYDELLRNVNQGRTILFLTEASMVGEDGALSEEHVDKYREILSSYSFENVMIKPHPSDYVDYKRCFPECYVLARDFPVQMIVWCDIKITKFIISSKSSCRDIFMDNFDVEIFDEN